MRKGTSGRAHKVSRGPAALPTGNSSVSGGAGWAPNAHPSPAARPGSETASTTAGPAGGSRPARRPRPGRPVPSRSGAPSRSSRDADPARPSRPPRAHRAARGAAAAGRRGPPWRDAAEAGMRRLRGRREGASTDSRGPAAAAPAQRGPCGRQRLSREQRRARRSREPRGRGVSRERPRLPLPPHLSPEPPLRLRCRHMSVVVT